MNVKPVPDGFHTVTPYLAVNGAAALIEFLKKAFEGEELFRMPRPDGMVAHAVLKIGDSPVMMGDCPQGHEVKKNMLYMYVKDVDTVYARAIAAGGKSIMSPTDQFYGDRSGALDDPCGNTWWIATHKEDVSLDELQKRMAQVKK